MKITPPGLLTEGNYSDDALILEARWLLAYRYKWDGRCIEASRCVIGSGRFSIADLLEVWDLYNRDLANKSRRNYFISARIESDPWGVQPTDSVD